MKPVAILAALLGVVLATVVLLRGSDDTYQVKVALESANGLRTGSLVKVGGVGVGRVDTIRLDDRDQVQATLELDRGKVKLHGDAEAQVTTSNLLGSKFIQLDSGRKGPRIESGGRITHVSYPTDLDQVLDVLDVRTRARLAVMIDELGQALAGRTADFSGALAVLPPSLDRAQKLVSDLASDNRALGKAIDRSGSFVGGLRENDRSIARLVDSAGSAFSAIAERDTELKATLTGAPGTLRELQTFLGRLRETTKPLGPAADALAATAGPLDQTLKSLPGFTAAARPTLRKATDVAPLLTRLAQRSTPVLRRTRPTAESLRVLTNDLAPVTRAGRVSIDDALGVLEGWARSIQGRDGLGRYFRGYATISPDIVRSLIETLVEPPASKKAKRKARRRKPTPSLRLPLPSNPSESPRKPAAKVPELLQPLTDKLPELLDGVTGALGGRTKKPSASGEPSDESTALLDFLLNP